MGSRLVYTPTLAILHASGTLMLFAEDTGVMMQLTEWAVSSRAWFSLGVGIYSRHEGQIRWCMLIFSRFVPANNGTFF